MNKLLASFFLGICIFIALVSRADNTPESQIQSVVCRSMVEFLDAYQGQLRFLERNPNIRINKTIGQWAYDATAKRMMSVITTKGIKDAIVKEKFDKMLQYQRDAIVSQYEVILKAPVKPLADAVFHDCTTQWDLVSGH